MSVRLVFWHNLANLSSLGNASLFRRLLFLFGQGYKHFACFVLKKSLGQQRNVSVLKRQPNKNWFRLIALLPVDILTGGV